MKRHCRAALTEALGKYMVMGMRLASVYGDSSGGVGGGGAEFAPIASVRGEAESEGAAEGRRLTCDMGEGLAMYHATTSRVVDYARLVI